MLQYIGSSTDPVKRWAVHKSECNLRNDKTWRTGLTRHFINGFKGDGSTSKVSLRITLIDHIDTCSEELMI